MNRLALNRGDDSYLSHKSISDNTKLNTLDYHWTFNITQVNSEIFSWNTKNTYLPILTKIIINKVYKLDL